MAAFINAIGEESTREDALRWVHKIRAVNGMDYLNDLDFDGWTKTELVQELIRLWRMQHVS